MATFSYSIQASFLTKTILGCMVWGHGQARYYACPGEEDRADGYNEEFQSAPSDGRTLQDIIDYYLERGGGGYLSFTLPEEVEALSWDAAARQVATLKEIELMLPRSPRPHCSRCGSLEDLHLVTVLLFGPDVSGRILVYCAKCRTELAHKLDVDLPLAELDVEVFVGLYRDGKTESAPKMASEIAFGEVLPGAVKGAEEALKDLGTWQSWGLGHGHYTFLECPDISPLHRIA